MKRKTCLWRGESCLLRVSDKILSRWLWHSRRVDKSMLLFFVLFIFFILHVQFLLRNIFLGVDELNFFHFTMNYGFTREVAIESLLFSLSCAIAFAVGYILFYRKRKVFSGIRVEAYSKVPHRELLMLNTMGIMMITYLLVVMTSANFDYTAMVQIRETSGFIFELRMIFLLLLSHVLLNVPFKHLLMLRQFKPSIVIIFIYFICVLLFQARSAAFELGAVIAVSQLMWMGDKIKLKYIVFVFCVMLVPNLIVMGRLGVPGNFSELMSGLFSFEYSIVVNKFLSAAIDSGVETVQGISFVPSLQLLIPSPLRDLFGISVEKSGYYADIADAIDFHSGGFSLLAEMLSNFGWYAPLFFGAIAILLGRMFSRAARVGNVDLISATAPLLYVAFVLAFRNDFGVFLKYVVQLFLIAFIFNFALKLRLGK